MERGCSVLFRHLAQRPPVLSKLPVMDNSEGTNVCCAVCHEPWRQVQLRNFALEAQSHDPFEGTVVLGSSVCPRCRNKIERRAQLKTLAACCAIVLPLLYLVMHGWGN